MSSHCRFARAARAVSLVLLPILAAYAAPVHAAKSKKALKDFEYSVSDCLGPDKKDSVGLEVSDGSVSFNQILAMNCIAATRPNTVKVSYAKKARELQVVVSLSSEVLSDCTCPIGIDGRISNLGKGTYRISFVFDFKPGQATHEKPTRQALGSKEFSIE
jgi:hypothetical protein